MQIKPTTRPLTIMTNPTITRLSRATHALDGEQPTSEHLHGLNLQLSLAREIRRLHERHRVFRVFRICGRAETRHKYRYTNSWSMISAAYEIMKTSRQPKTIAICSKHKPVVSSLPSRPFTTPYRSCMRISLTMNLATMAFMSGPNFSGQASVKWPKAQMTVSKLGLSCFNDSLTEWKIGSNIDSSMPS